MRHSGVRRRLRLAAMLAAGLLAAGCGGAGVAAKHPAGVSPVAARHRVHHPAAPPMYPLTGRRAPSAAAAERPVLAVKIDNVAGAFPQWGVNNADVVIEEIVEGGLTRLVAAYQSQGAPRVGPIRSARPVDADIERLWNGGILAYSGAAPGEIRPSIQHGHALLENATTFGTPFYRGSGYAVPHNLFSSTAALYRGAQTLATQTHHPIGHPVRPLFTFGTPTGRLAHQISLTVSSAAWCRWVYSPASGQYLRWQDGSPDMIAGTGQARATNVVVMQVRLKQTNIVDDAGNHDPLDVILGKGRAWVFSHGREAAGSWSRPDDAAPMRLTSTSGTPMRVAPGRTWIEFLPVGHTPSVSR